MQSNRDSPPKLREHRRGLIAVLDQLLISGTNFIALVAIGRTAGPEELGKFTLGFSVMIVVTTSMRSLVATPYAVLGNQSDERPQRLMRGCVLIAWLVLSLLTLVFIGILWIGSFLLHGHIHSWVLFAITVGFSITASSLRELGRHISLADLQFGRALGLDGSSSLLQLALIAVLCARPEFSATDLMLTYLVPSGMAGIVWIGLSRRAFLFDRFETRDAWRRIWTFGRWGVVSQASHAIQGYAVSWILVLTSGLQAAGVFSAASSIVQIGNPFVQGIGNALIPLLSKRRALGGRDSLLAATRQVTLLGATAGGFYLALMIGLGQRLLIVIYGEEYDRLTPILIALTLAFLVSALTLVAQKVISVMKFPRVNSGLNVLTMLTTVACSAVLGSSYGIGGAVSGLLIAAICGASAKWIAFSRIMRG